MISWELSVEHGDFYEMFTMNNDDFMGINCLQGDFLTVYYEQ